MAVRLRPALSLEKGVAKIVVPLDPESIRKMIDIVSLLKGAEHVEELGTRHIVIRVPRFTRLMGYRRVKLEYKLYETDETEIFIAKGGVDSIILTIDVIDTGEGAHVVISGGGAGSVSKIVDELVQHIARNLARTLTELTPQLEIVPKDNQLASLSGVFPSEAVLVYYDSFVPVRNTVVEAAQRVIALLGPGDYLVEVSGYHKGYLLRFVLRSNKITGVYAEVNNEEDEGQRALLMAARPPEYRVKIKAWSLRGSDKTYFFEAEPVYVEEDHYVYWIGASSSPEYGGLVPNTYVVLSGYQSAVIDPSGGSRFLRILRNLVQDLESVRYILVSLLEADIAITLQSLADKVHSARLYAPPHSGLLLSHIVPWNDRVTLLPSSQSSLSIGGEGELTIIPSKVRGVTTLSFYDPRSRVLFTGEALGAIAPPGLWNIYMDELDTYFEMVKAYIDSCVDKTEFRKWMDIISSLDISVIAPRYGPMLRGRSRIEALLQSLSKW